MTIKELTNKLTVEFKDFAKDYDLKEYGYDEIFDEFAVDYFGYEYQEANLFLDSLKPTEMIELLDDMASYYEDPITVMTWLGNPLDIANEIISYIIEVYIIDNMED